MADRRVCRVRGGTRRSRYRLFLRVREQLDGRGMFAPICKNEGVKCEVGDWVRHDARLACASTLSCVFDARFRSNYTRVPLREMWRIHWQGEKRENGMSAGETA